MPDDKGESNDPDEGDGLFSRRRLLQATGASVAAGALASGVTASSDELPHTIVIDGSVDPEAADYEFLVSGQAQEHPEIGGVEPSGGHVAGTVEDGQHAYEFDGTLSYLDVDGTAEVTLHYNDYTTEIDADRLEIVATSDGSVEYTFESEDAIQKVLDAEEHSADADDVVTETDEGTWIVEGSTANGDGDTYLLSGELDHFEPVTGEYTLFYNGEETTVTELTGQEPPADDEDEEEETAEGGVLSIRSTDDTPAMFYEFTVEGEIVALEDTMDHDDVYEEDDHWRVEGQVGPNGTDSYDVAAKLSTWEVVGSDGEHVDESRFGLYWNDEEVSLADVLVDADDGEDGDGEADDGEAEEDEDEEDDDQDEEITEHVLSIRSTNDTPAMFYEFTADTEITALEDTMDHDDVYEEDDHWRVEGQVGPNGTDSYALGSKLTDWAVVDRNDNYVFESRFGLYWDDEETTLDEVVEGGYEPPEEEPDEPDPSGDVGIRHDAYDGVLGGGDGMSEDLVYSSDEADVVVSSMLELQNAVDAASSGDVIYVSGSISGGLTVNTAGVTIAGNRGIGSDGRWTAASLTQNAPVRLDGLSIDCGWSDFCSINSSGLELYNCLVENHNGYAPFTWNVGDSGAWFSHCEFRDWNYYGFQVRFNWHSESSKITIQYCDLHDLGQHMVQGGYGWIHFRDNYCHGRLNHSSDHVLEVRGQGGAPVPCGNQGGNAIVEHNVSECFGSSMPSGLVRVRCTPTDRVVVRNNTAPYSTGPVANCHGGGWNESIVYQPTSTTGSFQNVTLEGNEWGHNR